MGTLSKIIPVSRALLSSPSKVVVTRIINFKQLSSVTNSNKNSSGQKEGSLFTKMKWPGIITGGIIIGGVTLLTLAKNFLAQNENEFNATMAPAFPYLHARMPLWKIEAEKSQCERNRELTSVELEVWKFRYQHLADALGVEINEGDDNESLLKKISLWDLNSWSLKVTALFGSEDYGEKKVHHVILTNIQRIKKDVAAQEIRLQAAPNLPNRIWISEKVPIVTFIWDDIRRTYRAYVYEGYVLMDLSISQKDGSVIRPLTIKFISENAYPSAIKGYSSNYGKTIIDKFGDDMVAFQRKCRYLS